MCNLHNHTWRTACATKFLHGGDGGDFTKIPTVPLYFRVPLYPLFLCTHCSSLPTVFLFLCTHCSSTSTVPSPPLPLYLMFLCAYCSFVPLYPLFLCTHCSSVPPYPLLLSIHCSYSSSVSNSPQYLLFLRSSVPTIPPFLCPCSSVPSVPLFLRAHCADQCSMWLLDDEEQPCEIYGGNSSEIKWRYDPSTCWTIVQQTLHFILHFFHTSSELEKTTTVQELSGHQHKAALKGKKLPSTCQQKFGP